MAGVSMYDYQVDAVNKMHNGCILNGGVGSGKSRTALAYYYMMFGGELNTPNYVKMKNPCSLFIITTARKRDTGEWEKELGPFCLSSDMTDGLYDISVKIDSWNNVGKYVDIKGAFFIFDEQRVVGKGEWVKSFLKICRNNKWILLSATPGDCWMDYVPVFIANGFYRNRTEFNNEHVKFKAFSKFPQVETYLNTGRLIKYRNYLLIDMDFHRKTEHRDIDILCSYDKDLYKLVLKNRQDPYNNMEPFQNISGLCYCLRRIVNSDPCRGLGVLDILEEHPRSIIFYNYDYELEILRNLDYEDGTEIAEWNGHLHQDIPESARWVYLVQYSAGAEGWNCISTDTIIFYSQTYSYKTLEQAKGRIDRLTTPYIDLWYYHLHSRANIDLAIRMALKKKKKFNERNWKVG